MDCGIKFVRFLVFVFNFLFVISGIALISIGAVAKASGDEYTVFLSSKYVTAPTLLIIVGCIIFIIAFFGCCGALRESAAMVNIFAGLLILIFVLELAGGITAYVYRNQVKELIEKNMNDTITQHKEDAMKAWDKVQKNEHCCGVKGADDWIKNKYEIPKSCCKSLVNGTCEKKDAYEEGCYDKFIDTFNKKIATVGGSAIGIAFVELLGVAFACCLSSAIKREYESV